MNDQMTESTDRSLTQSMLNYAMLQHSYHNKIQAGPKKQVCLFLQ